MFPKRPGRPIPSYRSAPIRRTVPGRQVPTRPNNLLSQFQTPDGDLDFEKISATAEQIHGIYNQVSPLISQVSPLITRFIKR